MTEKILMSLPLECSTIKIWFTHNYQTSPKKLYSQKRSSLLVSAIRDEENNAFNIDVRSSLSSVRTLRPSATMASPSFRLSSILRYLPFRERAFVDHAIKNGTAHFLAFSLIIQGATEKVLQFIMPLQSIYNQDLCFIEQTMYF